MGDIVFILEEKSMELFLRSIESALREHLGLTGQRFLYRSPNGKGNMRKGCHQVIRLHAKAPPGCRFMIVCDRDDDDCIRLKKDIQEIASQCEVSGRSRVRIVCRELEAWLLGDRVAFVAAFPGSGIGKATHERPDNLPRPKEIVQRTARSKATPKIARRVGSKMTAESIGNNKSASFRCFVSGLDRLCGKHRQPR